MNKTKLFNYSNNSENTHARVWDIENKGWRTLILDNIIEKNEHDPEIEVTWTQDCREFLKIVDDEDNKDNGDKDIEDDNETESFDSDSFDPHKIDIYNVIENCEVDDFIKFAVRGVILGVFLSCLLNFFKFITEYYTKLFDEKIL